MAVWLYGCCQPCHFVVLAALYQKKAITWRDLQNWKGHAQNMLLYLVLDHCQKSAEHVATTAKVLHEHGCRKEANMFTCKLALRMLISNVDNMAIQSLSVCNWRIVTTFAECVHD